MNPVGNGLDRAGVDHWLELSATDSKAGRRLVEGKYTHALPGAFKHAERQRQRLVVLCDFSADEDLREPNRTAQRVIEWAGAEVVSDPANGRAPAFPTAWLVSAYPSV